jgi:hypothetical protein
MLINKNVHKSKRHMDSDILLRNGGARKKYKQTA